MKSEILYADGSGLVAIPGGAGLIVEPWDKGALYPVDLHINSNPSVKEVLDSDRPYEPGGFLNAQLRGVEPESQWLVTTWGAGERVGARSGRGRPVRVMECTLNTLANGGPQFLAARSVSVTPVYFDCSRFSAFTFSAIVPAVAGYVAQSITISLELVGQQVALGETIALGSANQFGAAALVTGYASFGPGMPNLTGTHSVTRGVWWPGRVGVSITTDAEISFDSGASATFELWGTP